MKALWRTQYSGDAGDYTMETAARNVTFRGERPLDLTVQSEKDSCDINVLVRRFGVTNMPQRSGAYYGDFSQVEDYQTAIEQVRVAQESFMELDARTRERFENDPARLMKFMSDPRNHDEAIRLGLIERPKVDQVETPPVRAKVDVVEPPKAAKKAAKAASDEEA